MPIVPGPNQVNPLLWKDNDLPKIVFESDSAGLFGFAVQEITDGDWNHAMLMHKSGLVASMDFSGFHEDKISAYMKDNIALKFYSFVNMTSDQKNNMMAIINEKLKTQRSWWAYDWTGIVGQALHIPALRNPYQKFCSEQAADIVRQSMNWPIPGGLNPNGLEQWCADNIRLVIPEGTSVGRK